MVLTAKRQGILEMLLGGLLAFFVIGELSPELESKVFLELFRAVVGVLFLTALAFVYRHIRGRTVGQLETAPGVEVPEHVKTVLDLLVYGAAVIGSFVLAVLIPTPSALVVSVVLSYFAPTAIPRKATAVAVVVVLLLALLFLLLSYQSIIQAGINPEDVISDKERIPTSWLRIATPAAIHILVMLAAILLGSFVGSLLGPRPSLLPG